MPWFDHCLQLVSSYADQFTGSQRDDRMFEHIRAGLGHTKDLGLRQLFMRAKVMHEGSIVKMVDLIKKELNINDLSAIDSAKKKLLAWAGAKTGEPMIKAWNEWK